MARSAFQTLFWKSKYSLSCGCISRGMGAQLLAQEADLRVGQRNLRAGVSPRPEQAVPRSSHLFEQTRNGIGLAIGPATGRCFGTYARPRFLQISAGSQRPGDDDLDLDEQLELPNLG